MKIPDQKIRLVLWLFHIVVLLAAFSGKVKTAYFWLDSVLLLIAFSIPFIVVFAFYYKTKNVWLTILKYTSIVYASLIIMLTPFLIIGVFFISSQGSVLASKWVGYKNVKVYLVGGGATNPYYVKITEQYPIFPFVYWVCVKDFYKEPVISAEIKVFKNNTYIVETRIE